MMVQEFKDITMNLDYLQVMEFVLKVTDSTLKETFKNVEGFECYYNLNSGIINIYSDININLDMETVRILLINEFNKRFKDLFKYNVDIILDNESNEYFYKYVFYIHLI